MSWEVWTMPQKTSFCNRTLLRSDLRHFWPAGFVYVLIWLMILPIQLLRAGYDAPRDDGLLAETLEPLLHNVIVGASVGSLVLAVVCGVVIPMAVYAYLMTPRSVGMMHALPVKRTTQYFSHFLAGFGLLTAGNLLIFLLSVLAQLPFGMVDWSALGQWLLLTELLELFFLSLGALCAMVTGWLLAIPVLYVAVNFAALLLCSVVQFLQRWFYFGFQYTTYPPFVQWLTPIIKLAEDVGFLDGEYITRNGIEVYWRSLSAQALPTSAIYAAAGLVLLALGWLLYRKRPSETAGDAIAFPWLRILVRWAVGLCGGLGLGLFLSSFVLGGSRSLAKLLLCQVFMGLLCFVAAQMLLQKTFRVFRRSWKELAALAGEVGHICRRTLEVPQVLSCKGMTTLLFSERPALRAVFGAASAAARGEVSGDAVQQFCSPTAAQMILCDGMGTGRPAAVDGNLAAELTARLLKAGFTAELAARLVNVALALKSEDESGATLDLISVDLYTGTARLFKAGAAPGFLDRKSVV